MLLIPAKEKIGDNCTVADLTIYCDEGIEELTVVDPSGFTTTTVLSDDTAIYPENTIVTMTCPNVTCGEHIHKRICKKGRWVSNVANDCSCFCPEGI